MFAVDTERCQEVAKNVCEDKIFDEARVPEEKIPECERIPGACEEVTTCPPPPVAGSQCEETCTLVTKVEYEDVVTEECEPAPEVRTSVASRNCHVEMETVCQPATAPSVAQVIYQTNGGHKTKGFKKGHHHKAALKGQMEAFKGHHKAAFKASKEAIKAAKGYGFKSKAKTIVKREAHGYKGHDLHATKSKSYTKGLKKAKGFVKGQLGSLTPTGSTPGVSCVQVPRTVCTSGQEIQVPTAPICKQVVKQVPKYNKVEECTTSCLRDTETITKECETSQVCEPDMFKCNVCGEKMVNECAMVPVEKCNPVPTEVVCEECKIVLVEEPVPCREVGKNVCVIKEKPVTTMVASEECNPVCSQKMKTECEMVPKVVCIPVTEQIKTQIPKIVCV